MAMSPSNPGNKPKTSSTYGNPFQGVKKPSGMSAGKGHGATNHKQNSTATRGSGGIGIANGIVK